MSFRLLDRLLLLCAGLVGLGLAAGIIFFFASIASGEALQTTLPMRFAPPPVHDVLARGTQTVVGELALDRATLQVRAGGIVYRLLQLLDMCLVGGLWLFIVMTLRRLAGRIAAKDPFSAHMVTRMRAVGWSLILLNLWAWIRMALLPLLMLRDIDVADNIALLPSISRGVAGASAQVDVSLSITLFICGLLLLTLAEAFRIGGELREESEAIV